MAKKNQTETAATVITIQTVLENCRQLMADPTRIRHAQSFDVSENPEDFDVFTTEDAHAYWQLWDHINAQYEAAADVQGWKRGPNRRGTKVKESHVDKSVQAAKERVLLYAQRNMTAEETVSMTINDWLIAKTGQNYHDLVAGLIWDIYPIRVKKDAVTAGAEE